MEKGLYVFGLVQEINEELTEMKGIDNTNRLFPVELDGVYIIASEVDMEKYGESKISTKLTNMLWVSEKARIHYYIINHLAKKQILLPAKFCTIFLNEDDLKSEFSKHTEGAKKAFDYLKDKEEWTFKVFYDSKKHTEEKINMAKEEITKELSRLAYQVKMNSSFSKQSADLREDMILNMAILISREKLNELCKCLSELKEKLNISDFQFELVGPWPYYNFTELFVRLNTTN